MAGSVNKVILVGNLGRDPEVRSFPNGGKVVNLRIATSESWRDKQSGERKERTEWHSVAIYNDNVARIAEQYLRKGSKVYLEGQLETRKWQDASGQDRTAEKVSISHQFASRIISNDRLTVDALPIKYLPGEQGKDSVIIWDDADKQADLDHEMIYVGAGAGVVGILGSGLWFLLGRRRSAARTEAEQPAA